MKKLANKFLVIFGIILLSSSLMPTIVNAADESTSNSDRCSQSFLGFPTWYRGLVDGDCNVISPTAHDAGTNEATTDISLAKFISIIALNVVEIGVMASSYVAFFFILFGGFKYLTSAGSSTAVEGAKKTITNAVIGLVLSILAVAIITFVFNRLNA